MLKEMKHMKEFLESEQRLEKIWKSIGAFLIFEIMFITVVYTILRLYLVNPEYFNLMNDLFILPGLYYSYT